MLVSVLVSSSLCVSLKLLLELFSYFAVLIVCICFNGVFFLLMYSTLANSVVLICAI